MELLNSAPAASSCDLEGFYLGTETHRPRLKPRKLLFDDGSLTSPFSASSSLSSTYYSDRYIPVRSPSTPFDFGVSSTDENLYSMVLRNELSGAEQLQHDESSPIHVGSPTRNMFHYSSSPTKTSGSQFSLSPISKSAQKMLECPRKPPRSIPKTPIKSLEAPTIQDDFYLNLVDWSSQNVVAVALTSSIYLWNALTSSVTRLCDLGRDQVTSVAWSARGSILAVGSSSGIVQLWDVTKSKCIREFIGHRQRVCAVAWNNDMLASGSRDRSIIYRDTRMQAISSQTLLAHKQEVCGLRWSPDGRYLASGGNDNRLLVWDPSSSSQPLHRLFEHSAAVKAIAWSPHQRSLLASGGGTVDRTIRIWNISGETPTKSILSVDTGSQVCNLAWSKNVNELVSTHGYSQNQVVVWTYPSMTPIATLTGHTMRVLFLAVSPDGQTIVTGAGDETLRLWNVFPGPKNGGASPEALSSLGARMEIR